ncbi:MAG: hypothetical protein H6867_09610 [Rhodospirillales bacterium]|nr:hypothetical protein [Rhodospirillales bacterium]MCB9995960.1 hypothetical protein [Rhodospirillales bacterium]
MKNKTLMTAAFLSAFATSAALADDTPSLKEIGEHISDSCDDVADQLGYAACITVAALESKTLVFAVSAFIDAGKIKEEEARRVISTTFKNDQNCMDLFSNRPQILQDVRDNLDDMFQPVTSEQFKVAASMFGDMGTCYNNIAVRINADGSPALKEVAPVYEKLARQALAVQKNFSAKIQP